MGIHVPYISLLASSLFCSCTSLYCCPSQSQDGQQCLPVVEGEVMVSPLSFPERTPEVREKSIVLT